MPNYKEMYMSLFRETRMKQESAQRMEQFIKSVKKENKA